MTKEISPAGLARQRGTCSTGYTARSARGRFRQSAAAGAWRFPLQRCRSKSVRSPRPPANEPNRALRRCGAHV